MPRLLMKATITKQSFEEARWQWYRQQISTIDTMVHQSSHIAPQLSFALRQALWQWARFPIITHLHAGGRHAIFYNQRGTVCRLVLSYRRRQKSESFRRLRVMTCFSRDQKLSRAAHRMLLLTTQRIARRRLLKRWHSWYAHGHREKELLGAQIALFESYRVLDRKRVLRTILSSFFQARLRSTWRRNSLRAGLFALSSFGIRRRMPLF